MGYAVDNLASQSAQTTSPRKQRPSKPGTNVAHYTGNLVAYSHDLSALNSLVASSAKPVPPAPVDVKPVSDSTKPDTHTKTKIAAAVAANSSYARPGLLKAAGSSLAQRAIPVTGCLLLVGVAGLTWYLLNSGATPDIQQPSTLSDNASDASSYEADNPDLAAPAATQIAVVPSAQPAEAIIIESVTLEEPTALRDTAQLPSVETPVAETAITVIKTPDFTAEFREEIEWLQGQNVDLRGQIVVLEEETLALHEEIFQKELEQLAQEAKARETGKPNVVYQYVEVPLGSYVGNAPAGYSGAYGNNASNSSASVSYGPAAMPSVPYIEPSSPPLMGSPDSEIAFDPDTGFYINPNYSNENVAATDSSDQSQLNGLASSISTRTEYPPVSNE